MKMNIMYEQKTLENLKKTNDFKKSLTREKEKKSTKDSFPRGAHGSKML